MTVPPEGERLQKVLARTGLGSRRVCEEMIAEGRVEVNGVTAELGRRVDPEHDRVSVDGIPVPVRPDAVYYLLNKPGGVITTARDPQGRSTVLGLVPPEPRVVPAGRLDAATEGLLVLTNDGDLVYTLTHPSRGVEKAYLAEVEGRPPPAAIRRLREGVVLEDGPTAPAKVTLVQEGTSTSALELVIHEGRNRQVRRMCEAVGHPVVRLVRTRIGPVSDHRLEPGRWRMLEPGEVRALYGAAGARPHPASPEPGARPGDAADPS